MLAEKRIQWIDISKGIGILLVIVGHCVNSGNYTFRWIFSFHMPLFLILSGLCFKEKKMGVMIRKKFEQLLVPYFAFCLVGFIVSMIIPSWRHISINKTLLGLYQGYPNTLHISSTWFLNCLFIISIVFNLIILLSKNRHRMLNITSYLLLFLIVVFGFYIGKNRRILSNLPAKRMPLTSDSACVGLLFFAFGYWIKKVIFQYSSVFRKKYHLHILGALLSFTATIFIINHNGTVNLHAMTYRKIPLFIMGAIAGFLFVYFISLIVQDIRYLNNILIWYGQNSLKIMGTQSIVLRLYHLMLKKLTGHSFKLYKLTLPYSLYAIIFITVVSTIAIIFYNKIKKMFQQRQTEKPLVS